MKKMRKLLACLMILCIALSLMPGAAAFADGEEGSDVHTHTFENGVCTGCGEACTHTGHGQDGVCPDCGSSVEHTYTDGTCSCGLAGGTEKQTEKQNESCEHSWEADEETGKHICSKCGASAAHEYDAEGCCVFCEAKKPAESDDAESAAAKIARGPEEKKYSTLASALADAAPGETVILLDYVTENVTVGDGVTLDLGGFAIDGGVTAEGSIRISNGGIDNALGTALSLNAGSAELNALTLSGKNGIDAVNSVKDSIINIEIIDSEVIGYDGFGINGSCLAENSLVTVTLADGSAVFSKSAGIEIANGSLALNGTEEESVSVSSNEGKAVNLQAGSLSAAYADCGDVFLGADTAARISSGYYAGTISSQSSNKGIVTGGIFTEDPGEYCAEGYVAFNEDGLFAVRPGIRVDGKPIEVNRSDSPAQTELSDGVDAQFVNNTSSISMLNALNTQMLLTGLEILEGDQVNIEITPDVTVERVDSANGTVSSIRFSVKPKAIVTVVRNGETASEKTVSVPNNMLNGSEILLSLPIPAGMEPADINRVVHELEDGSTEIFCREKAAETDKLFTVDSMTNTVRVAVNSFSGFTLFTGTDIAAVYGPDGNLKARCTTIEEIAEQLGSGCTVQLLADINDTSVREIDLTDMVIYLDLNGHSFTGVDKHHALKMTGGTLTVSDSSAGGSGCISGDPALDIGAGATVTLKSGSILSGGSHVVYVRGGTLNVEGGSIRSVDNPQAVGINILLDGNVNISGGTLRTGSAAAYVFKGAMNISGGWIDGYSDAANPGAQPDISAAAALTGARVAISGGSFKHPVPVKYCAPGYEPCDDTANPGRYTVGMANHVAWAADRFKVNKGSYKTVQEAVAAAGESGTVTLLRDSEQSALLAYKVTLDGAGYSMKSVTVNTANEPEIKNLVAETVLVNPDSSVLLDGENVVGETVNFGICRIKDGRYAKHSGGNTYEISGGIFGDNVTAEQCARVRNPAVHTDGAVGSYIQYAPAENTDETTKTDYPYTVAPAVPRITGISNGGYFQRGSGKKLVISTDWSADDLVMLGDMYNCVHIYDSKGYKSTLSSRYYTVSTDENTGNAVITIENYYLKYKATENYTVDVDFVTGETQQASFRIGMTPLTGDASNIGLWIGIMVCSLIIVGCVAFVVIRKNRKGRRGDK